MCAHRFIICKKSKAEEREITEVITMGTIRDMDLIAEDPNSRYLMVICQNEDPLKPAFGISFVDATTNEFRLTSFDDDEKLSLFETMLLRTQPIEILCEKVRSCFFLLAWYPLEQLVKISPQIDKHRFSVSFYYLSTCSWLRNEFGSRGKIF